jgi:hypothetical protein
MASHKLNLFYVLLVMILSGFTYYNYQHDKRNSIELEPARAAKELAIKDAANLPVDVKLKYLSCYALDFDAKAKCTAALSLEYITEQQDDNYRLEFQYAAEKLGFQEFLLSFNKPCDNINDGPLYDELSKAYLVKCSLLSLGGQKYFMQYDNNLNLWSLK